MNAADRSQLAALFSVAARFLQLPRPFSDETLPSADYIAAHDAAQTQFAQLQRDRAIVAGAHLEWLAETVDRGQDLNSGIQTIIRALGRDLAEPLPYPVKEATVPAAALETGGTA
ncbi:MAG: hypothetical protein ACRDNZ_18930 [Streptosporangiaceae bacterium]